MQVSQFFSQSQELGAGRSAGQALLLARELFGTPLDASLARRLESDRAVRRLTLIAWRQMTNLTEPTSRRLGTATIHLSQLLLLPGLRFKMKELCRQLADAAGNRA